MKKTILCTISLIMLFAMLIGCSGVNARYSDTRETAQMAPSAAPAAEAPMMRDSAMISGGAAAKGFDMMASNEADIADDMEVPVPDGGIAGPSANRVIDTRKIIKNVNMQLQTQTFDTSVEAVPVLVESFGGYIQDSYIEGRDMYNERGTRSANFTARIPVEKLDSFVNSVGSEFHVISKSQNSQDITENYYDSKARLDALRIQEERLLEMLRQAAELEYLLQVEKELMNVRYEIESLTSSLNRMDSYVGMSTVTIFLNEVVKYEPVENVPVTFSERILRAFRESWKAFGEFMQDFTVWFVAAFPFLLLLAAVAFIVILIIRINAKRIKAKRAKVGLVPPVPVPTVAPPIHAKENPPSEEKDKL